MTDMFAEGRPKEPDPSPTRAFFASRGWRFAMMVLLTLLMGIPLMMVVAVIEDRASYQRRAVNEVSNQWGGPVRLAGPVLVIPVEKEVTTPVRDRDGVQRTEKSIVRADPIVLLPDALDMRSDASSEIRRRGIFEVPVYVTELNMSARFDAKRAAEATIPGETILWDRATLSVTMPGTRSFSGKAVLTVDGRPMELEPGAAVAAPAPARAPEQTRSIDLEPGTPLGQSGIQARIGDPRGLGTFRLSMGLNGARELMFAPVGRQTEVEMTSDWPHPSFQGAFLPKSREISDAGFAATWSIPHLARDMAQVSRGNWYTNADFGVTFYNPVDFYQKVGRAAKYGILFIALTFLTVFLVERFATRPVHPAQFVLIGLAQCVFFLLLLSFSEQIGFTPAYMAASVATIGLIGVYGHSGLGLRRRSFVLAGALVVLYAVFYLILRSADYALLAGSILAFIAVALAMLLTRGEDWSGAGTRAQAV